MLLIEKLNEANLLQVLQFLFPSVKSISKKTFILNGKRMIVDYYFEIDSIKFAIEFDGPTHYTLTKTQIRDINIKQYCSSNNIILIRIPYFIQINNDTIPVLFGSEYTEKYDLMNKIHTEYESGFIDDKCMLPSDFNPWGQVLFVEQCMLFQNKTTFLQICKTAKQRHKNCFIGIQAVDCLQHLWYNIENTHC